MTDQTDQTLAATTPEHAIILVPGFFGFGTFGAKDDDDPKKVLASESAAAQRARREEAAGADARAKLGRAQDKPVRIQYFARVVDVLKETLGGNDQVLYINAEPSPTGALATRAKELYDEIEKQRTKGVKHIHLIGHSTGGVDVRLVANRGYGPLAKETDREAMLKSIRSVTTVSAPFHGAPVAAFFGSGYRTDFVVALLSMLSVLVTMSDLRLSGQAAMLGASILRRFGMLSEPNSVVIPMFLSGVDAATATQIHNFMGEIIHHHEALRDLSPNESGSRENRGEDLTATDYATIASYVTVAPKPPSYLGSLFSKDSRVLRLLYRFAYERAAPSKKQAGPFPDGEWLGGDGKARDAIKTERGINDGVVPAASQTIDGHAKGIVLGDHLDIVGHYDGKDGNGTFFKSGADFDGDRFSKFWTRIAKDIASLM